MSEPVPITSRLGPWIAGQIEVPGLVIETMRPLHGGAIQENWKVVCRDPAGLARELNFVLRKDAPATIRSSRPRREEFAILQAAFAAGVRVPRPVAFCADPTVFGAPFALMALVDGVGLGARIVKDATLGGDRVELARELGRQLAKIHAIPLSNSALSFLGSPPAHPARAQIERLRMTLDALKINRPALEWGLRWAQLHAPACPNPTLVHGDYRTGNYMVDARGLTAILDWEFAGFGDPHADLGWFCAQCWRFGRADLEAGGVGSRADFYAGYESRGGLKVDDARVRYWEVVAHLRWAVIALEQGHRHLSGRETSLELALTGRLVPELELAILKATAPATWSAAHAQ